MNMSQTQNSTKQSSQCHLEKLCNPTELTHTKLFINNLNLPKYPVPDLNSTLTKYIKSITPLLNEQELANTKKIVENFGSKDGIGQKLQQILIKHAEIKENWLEEWWLQYSYMGNRAPVVTGTNPVFVFPFEKFENFEAKLEYAAQLIQAAVTFKWAVFNDQIPNDRYGNNLFDMTQYAKIFGTCRIPGDKFDCLEYHPNSRHIIVLRNNNFFKLEIVNSNGELPSTKQLVGQLEEIFERTKEESEPVGVFTAQTRDNWYKVYGKLLADPVNENSVKEIQTCLFTVNFDKRMPENISSNPISVIAKQLLVGGGTKINSGNRWNDKAIQFVIGEDGSAGIHYEHSPGEGQVIGTMTDHLISFMKNNAGKELPETKRESAPTKLHFNLGGLKEDLQKAIIHMDGLSDNLEVNCFDFQLFGKEDLKQHNISPDSFVQIALQSTFYKIHKRPCGHYEAGSIRKFFHGRTETIRSCSIEAAHFSRVLFDQSKSVADRFTALKEAIVAHKQYVIEAMEGQAIDRHLLGLKVIAIENDWKLPELYSDVGFVRSTTFGILSSQVAAKCEGFMCFAPRMTAGYGCCYNMRSNNIYFGISEFVEYPETSCVKFSQELQTTLQEMFRILEINKTK